MSSQNPIGDDLPELDLRWRDHWRRTSNQLQRLQRALAVVGPRIRAREFVAPDAAARAMRYVDLAKIALKERNPDVGWARLHSAIELECTMLDDSEVDAEMVRLGNEVRAGAVQGWEASAIAELLASISGPEPRKGKSASRLVVRQVRLQHALRIRNTFFGNAYDVERIVAYRRLILVAAGMALLAVALIMLVKAPDTWNTPDSRFALGSALAGMIGAVTSASQRLVAHPDTAAPAELGSFTALVVRLFIGAVAALSVYLAELGGLVVFPGDTIAMLLLASFGVGFAERLVVYHPAQAEPHPATPAPILPRRV